MLSHAKLAMFGWLTGSPASFPKDFGSVEVRIRTIPAERLQIYPMLREITYYPFGNGRFPTVLPVGDFDFFFHTV